MPDQNGGPRPPAVDQRNTGVGFVDVLFALVVGKILDSSVDGALPAAGKAQLILAATVTISSWVGFHNSSNRSPYFLRFVNWPLAQFTIDIGLVYVYWLLAVYAEKAPTPGPSSVPTAKPEAILLAVTGGMYLAWDAAAWRIRTLEAYAERPIHQDIPSRRKVTAGFFIASLVALFIVVEWEPHQSGQVTGIDVALIILTLLYRAGKERATPRDALQPRADDNAS